MAVPRRSAGRHRMSPKRTARAADESVTLPARSILVAAGTQPNTVLGREDAANVFLDGK